MAVHEYVGARYVPKFSDLNGGVWDNSYSYESLEIVKYGNDYYTAKKPVPVGVDISDGSYWVMTGNYNGAIAQLEQEIGDLNDLTPIINTSIVDAINSITDFVTPQMFGAKGDGITDDTQALQDCFDHSSVNKIAVYIPAGTYVFTGLTIQAASHTNDEYLPYIYGSSSESSILKHTGSGAAITVIPKDGLNYIDGIVFTRFSLLGNVNTTYGFTWAGSAAFVRFDDLTIRNCATAGIYAPGNLWMSSFTNIFFAFGAYGLDMQDGTNTTILFDHLYAMQITNTAFRIGGSYSEIGCLAADNCSGNAVYDIKNFEGIISSLGCEVSNVINFFKFNNVVGDIGSIYCWKPTLTNTTYPIVAESSRITINNISFGSDSAVSSTLHLIELHYSFVACNSYKGVIIFDRPYSRTGADTSIFMFQGTKISTNTGRSYVGTDKKAASLINNSQFPAASLGPAIFSCLNGPRYTIDGTDAQWNTPVYNGDWFIESSPSTNHVAGYVMLQDSTGDITAAKQAVIPMVLYGSTANRPTGLGSNKTGLCYYDTTINKPIWWNGSAWKDATGANA